MTQLLLFAMPNAEYTTERRDQVRMHPGPAAAAAARGKIHDRTSPLNMLNQGPCLIVLYSIH